MALRPVKTHSHVKSNVIAELKWDSRVDETDVGVELQDSAVTLSGTVPSYAARAAAHRVCDVLDVINHIQVRLRPEVSSEEIREQIEEALERQADREVEQIEVAVEDGTVTLAGRVPSWLERRAAIEATRHAPGVPAINDQFEVVAGL